MCTFCSIYSMVFYGKVHWIFDRAKIVHISNALLKGSELRPCGGTASKQKTFHIIFCLLDRNWINVVCFMTGPFSAYIYEIRYGDSQRHSVIIITTTKSPRRRQWQSEIVQPRNRNGNNFYEIQLMIVHRDRERERETEQQKKNVEKNHTRQTNTT